MSKIKLKDLATRALRSLNAPDAIRVADRLRSRGLNYKQSMKLIVEWTGCEPAEWEALLYEGDVAPTPRPGHAW